ncbi:hypothetical protein SGFS_024880 [Streptomyces graminofaciens]|uniref:Uncharacterized protein n=1 Tax=Streptomyces graminofaciens TaxID=68212 RepID=A0ABN5VDS2_9ACTN|nr:hypothetical protein SGFS_024880 [Streptomyces graminofaciens]
MFAPTHHTLTGLDGQVVGDGTGQSLVVEVPSQYPTEVRGQRLLIDRVRAGRPVAHVAGVSGMGGCGTG